MTVTVSTGCKAVCGCDSLEATLDLNENVLRLRLSQTQADAPFTSYPVLQNGLSNPEIWTVQPAKKVASLVNGSVVIWMPSIYELAEEIAQTTPRKKGR